MSESKISVIIPVININDNFYNSVNSVINQSLKEIEILIIHNQPFFPIDESFYYSDPRVRIIKNYNNKAAWYSRNLGINEAKSKYISILDSEDFLLLDHLSNAYDKLLISNADLYCANYINNYGKYLYEERFYKKKNISYFDILTLNPIGHSTVVFRKSQITYYQNYYLRHDLALWIRLYKANYNFFYDQRTGCFRKNSNASLSANKLSTIKYYFKIFRKESNFNLFISLMLIVILILRHFTRIHNFKINLNFHKKFFESKEAHE